MNGNGSINMMNVAINNAQDTDRILTEQEILSAPDCIDAALKHGKRPADYCSDKSFKAFWGVSKEDMDRETKIEQKVSEEVSNRNFERTWGMSKEEMYEKNLADAKKQLADQKEEKIGRVFEKSEKLEEQSFTNAKDEVKTVSNNGIDPNDIDALKKGLSNQEPNIKGPSVEPSLNFVK